MNNLKYFISKNINTAMVIMSLLIIIIFYNYSTNIYQLTSYSPNSKLASATSNYNKIINNTKNFMNFLFNYENIITFNQSLQKENTLLHLKMIDLQNSLSLGEHMNKMNIIKKTHTFSSITTNVLYHDIKSGYVELDAGSNDMITLGAAVLSKGILIGKIIDVYPKTSKAMMFYNPDFKLSIQSTKSQITAIASGDAYTYNDNKSYLTINHITDQNLNKLQDSEYITTLGNASNFPSNIPIGIIIKDLNNAIIESFNTNYAPRFMDIITSANRYNEK